MNYRIEKLFGFIIFATIILLIISTDSYAQEPFFKKEKVIQYQNEHVHGSTIVELPNGDLLVGWFQGSGERWADDVQILGARKKRGEENWSKAFQLADVKEFPDVNPILFIDRKERLWMMWYTVIANQWSTSLLSYRISNDYLGMIDAPVWGWQENLLVKPGDKTEYGILPGDKFVESVNRQLEEIKKSFDSKETIEWWEQRAERTRSLAAGEDMKLGGRGMSEGEKRGFPYFRRMGWQTRSKPIITDAGRMIIPLYSDGLNFSLMAITDDMGENWFFSDPLVGVGNIQPTIAVASSGELSAFMRDNGPPPKRLHVSRSIDDGISWTMVKDSEFPNPGSAADIVTLDDGSWLMIYNDTERGRYSLAVSLSEDEGKTWPWKKHVEFDDEHENNAHYPAIIQGDNGDLHVTYSYFMQNVDDEERKTVYYASFNKAWIKSE